MKIEKLPSGSYRVQVCRQGIRCSLTFKTMPKKHEIEKALMEKLQEKQSKLPEKDAMNTYADNFIKLKREQNLSPTTIRGYVSIQNNTPQWFKDIHLDQITDTDLQKLCDEYFIKHSAKSTRNLISFWKNIVKQEIPQFSPNIKLPPRKTTVPEYKPTLKDIKRILAYLEGNERYYIVVRLLVNGLRRGEACAITNKDLSKDNLLTISKDMIVDENNKQVIKNVPKTDVSYRSILIPSDLADLIRQCDGYVFKGNMHTINEYMHTVQDQLGIPRFRLHILRHFAAALMLKNKFNTIQIEDYMGWEHGSQTMEKVYAYDLEPEESQKDIAQAFSELVD